MATYAIGDIHGCFESLQALWSRLPFDPTRDHLWLVGDLVNRGPKSLEVLRWAEEMHRQLGSRLQTVLGNHDLHLLAVAAGLSAHRPGDTLRPVLDASDTSHLLAWLASRPLLHRRGRTLLIHAGLLPRWTPKQAERKAKKVERAFARDDRLLLLDRASDASSLPAKRGRKIARLRRTLAALTRLRTCTAKGELCRHNGPPETAPKECLPWFEIPGRRTEGSLIVCGHWAALGLVQRANLLALDTGCAWGGLLSAIRLEDRTLFQQEALEPGLATPPARRQITNLSTGRDPAREGSKDD